MGKQLEVSQEVFEAMVNEAVEDLKKSGLDKEEIISIVRGQFGLKYISKFLEK